MEAACLRDLPFASKGTIRRFEIPDGLPPFALDKVHRPRDRRIYRAPIVIVQEYLHRGDPRPIVVVAESDLVYSAAYFGITFAEIQPDIAYLVAGVLSSAVASWYFLMAGSSFGLWKRRLMKSDIASMPMPNLERAIESDEGSRVARLTRALQSRVVTDSDWKRLDSAVCDLYGLDLADRMVVEDGLLRAGWQWKAGAGQIDYTGQFE